MNTEHIPDDLNRTLIGLLQQNARASYQEMADATGTSATTVMRRLTRLTESGALKLIASPPLGPEAVLVELAAIEAEVESALDALRRRDPADIGQITQHRRLMGGEWVIAGTRVPVWMIQDLWQSEHDVDAIIAKYPDLTTKDVQAALAFQLPEQPRRIG